MGICPYCGLPVYAETEEEYLQLIQDCKPHKEEDEPEFITISTEPK